MNRSRMFILAAVAFLVAIGVTLFTYRALSQRLKPVEDTTEIVVAALPVSVGARLTEGDLRMAPWPKAVPIEGSFQRISDAVGRGVVTSMVPNEPVLDSKLAASGSGAGLMATIPDGMRAISVKVNDVIGVAGFVVPGSRVDVILSGSPNGTNVEMSKVILENVQVLAAGQNVATDDNGKPQNVPVVTLLVTPEDSEKMALATIDGKIQLALRNPLDLEHANPSAVRREHLFSGTSPSAPPPPTPPRTTSAPRTTRPAARPTPVIEPTRAPEPVALPLAVKPETVVKQIQIIQGNRSETVTFEKSGEGSAQ